MASALFITPRLPQASQLLLVGTCPAVFSGRQGRHPEGHLRVSGRRCRGRLRSLRCRLPGAPSAARSGDWQSTCECRPAPANPPRRHGWEGLSASQRHVAPVGLPRMPEDTFRASGARNEAVYTDLLPNAETGRADARCSCRTWLGNSARRGASRFVLLCGARYDWPVLPFRRSLGPADWVPLVPTPGQGERYRYPTRRRRLRPRAKCL